MRNLIVAAAIAVTGAVGSSAGDSAHAVQPEILTVEDWQADLAQTVTALRETHPRPFYYVEAAAFDAAHYALIDAIPQLSDHQIMLRMAGLVGLLEDGHTRLGSPRLAGQYTFSMAHSHDEPPNHHGLYFSQLPIRFALFDDGVYIDDIAREYGEFVGAKLISIGGVDALDAVEASRAFTAADNAGGSRLIAADLLNAGAVLSEIGAVAEACGIRLVLEHDGMMDVCVDFGQASDPAQPTHSATQNDPDYTVSQTPQGHVLLTLDMITSHHDARLREAVQLAVERAEERDVPLVIDLRNNTGGNNAHGRAVVLSLVQSADINQWGRLFVLIGPRTFSAAQTLINELQLYTRVLFVGSPSGAHPDHFGDSTKIQLNHSGLTLRVSRLHWSSGVADDSRGGTQPHLPVGQNGADWYAGRDGALQAVADYRHEGLLPLVVRELRAGRIFNAYLAAQRDGLGSEVSGTIAAYMRAGEALEGEGAWLLAAYLYQIGLAAWPDEPDLQVGFDRSVAQL
jgi:hypothetical protein